MKKKDKKISNKKKIIICIVIISILITSISLFLINDKNKAKKQNNDPKNDFTNISVLTEADEVKAAKLIKENIVRVVNKVGEHEIVGTGFFIEEGYLLTNSHNVDIKGEISIEYFDGTTDKATVYSNSIDMDIALLKVDNPKVNYMTFIKTDNLEVTNNVLAAGYSFNFKGEASITKGSISAKRTSGIMNYIQSDISMNKGCSGGPLFNDKAQIIAMNTFASENGNIGISITSESITESIQILLKDPKANYLNTKRPVNPINDVLVNIGYTENETLELYNDTKIVKYVVEKDGGSIEENESKLTYYCDEGYTLSGTLCLKEEKYNATFVKAKTPEGYECKNLADGSLTCTNFNYTDGVLEYGCQGEYKRDGENCVQYYDTEETPLYHTSYGACFADDCYDIGTANIIFIEKISCSNSVDSANKYILSNEENIESNYKNFAIRNVKGYVQLSNGSYINETIRASNCVKETIGDVYIFYTKNELESMDVCKGGNIITAGNGYYCEDNMKVTKYAYNVSCSGYSLKLSYNNKKIVCTGKQSNITQPSYNCKCPEGFSHSDIYYGKVDGWNYYNQEYDCTKACMKEEHKIVHPSYKCNGNDILSGTSCIKRTITSAKTK